MQRIKIRLNPERTPTKQYKTRSNTVAIKEKPKAVKTRAASFVHPTTKETINVRVVKLTERNFDAVVQWLQRNKVTATGSTFVKPDGDVIDHKIRVVQDNWSYDNNGKPRNRRAVRVARLGDYLVRYVDGSYARIKESDFERDFTLA